MLRITLIIIVVASLIFGYVYFQNKHFEQKYGSPKCWYGEYPACQVWEHHDICPKDAMQPFCIEIGYCSKWTCIEDNRPWYKQILY